ncbi:MAG: YHS domain-containing protein [Bacteroidia bacterium]|nr:YHS domain-containing protein [Bacteroidia bacterium]MDW8134038.1 YHS domain-containing protein [Bacteroidia bacterium]
MGIIGLGLLVLTSCSSPSPTMQKAEKGLAVPVESLAIPYCPICEMHFARFSIRDTMTYEGKLYGFCSAACKDSFRKRGI